MVVVESMDKSIIEGNIEHIYYYRMVKSQISKVYNNDTINVQCYGIEIERQDLVDGSISLIQRDSISIISPERHKVHNLLKLLYANAVSPIHLVDIIGFYVDEYVDDFDCSEKQTAML